MKIKAPADIKKSVVSEELVKGKSDNANFICSFCNCMLSKLIDSSGQNPSHYCSKCQMSFDPEYDNSRKESKISPPDVDKEPAVTSIQNNMADKVKIKHTVPKRGGFAELEKKGIKFTSYNTTEKE